MEISSAHTRCDAIHLVRRTVVARWPEHAHCERSHVFPRSTFYLYSKRLDENRWSWRHFCSEIDSGRSVSEESTWAQCCASFVSTCSETTDKLNRLLLCNHIASKSLILFSHAFVQLIRNCVLLTGVPSV